MKSIVRTLAVTAGGKHSSQAWVISAALTALCTMSFSAVTVPAAFATETMSTDTVTSTEVKDALADVPGLLSNSDTVKTSADGDSAIIAATTDSVVDVPKDADGSVMLRDTDGGPTLALELPSTEGTSDAKVVAPGVVAYPSTDGTATAVQAPEAGGVIVLRVLETTAASQDQVFPVSLPAGGRIAVAEEGHALVHDASGEVVFTVAAPWAKDGNGVALTTFFRTDGNTLIQHVEFNADTPTPITMDPWWNTLGNYARCVLGIGVPAGVAWYFIATIGTKTALAAAKNWGRYQPSGGPTGAAFMRYASWVWDGCSRYLKS